MQREAWREPCFGAPPCAAAGGASGRWNRFGGRSLQGQVQAPEFVLGNSTLKGNKGRVEFRNCVVKLHIGPLSLIEITSKRSLLPGAGRCPLAGAEADDAAGAAHQRPGHREFHAPSAQEPQERPRDTVHTDTQRRIPSETARVPSWAAEAREHVRFPKGPLQMMEMKHKTEMKATFSQEGIEYIDIHCIPCLFHFILAVTPLWHRELYLFCFRFGK